jgi:hypothetical protein
MALASGWCLEQHVVQMQIDNKTTCVTAAMQQCAAVARWAGVSTGPPHGHDHHPSQNILTIKFRRWMLTYHACKLAATSYP